MAKRLAVKWHHEISAEKTKPGQTRVVPDKSKQPLTFCGDGKCGKCDVCLEERFWDSVIEEVDPTGEPTLH